MKPQPRKGIWQKIYEMLEEEEATKKGKMVRELIKEIQNEEDNNKSINRGS